MALMRRSRDPLAGLGGMERALRDMREMLDSWPFRERAALLGVDWMPSCNVSETPQEYRIEAELPGVKPEDLEVKVEAGTLMLRGERRQEKEEKGKKYRRVESAYGSFMRSFTLPEDADEDAITAEHRDGLLVVSVPRTERKESKARAIDVSS